MLHPFASGKLARLAGRAPTFALHPKVDIFRLAGFDQFQEYVRLGQVRDVGEDDFSVFNQS